MGKQPSWREPSKPTHHRQKPVKRAWAVRTKWINVAEPNKKVSWAPGTSVLLRNVAQAIHQVRVSEKLLWEHLFWSTGPACVCRRVLFRPLWLIVPGHPSYLSSGRCITTSPPQVSRQHLAGGDTCEAAGQWDTTFHFWISSAVSLSLSFQLKSYR